MQAAIQYLSEVPENTPTSMMVAFAAGVVSSHLGGGNFEMNLSAGSLSLVATAINGLISPFFKRWANHHQLTGFQESFRTFICIAGADCICFAAGYEPNIKKDVFMTSFYFLEHALGRRGDLSQADWIVIAPKRKLS